MKTFLTVSAFVLFAFTASAQVMNNANLLPPTVANNTIVMPGNGSALVVNGGSTAACATPQTVHSFGGAVRIICTNLAPATSNAATLADLAPAAGGPRGPQILSDRNLSSDSSLGLRNDAAIIQ
jgi:hypothetical protein